ncbi:MAG: undecaprenyl diphosphate synthase family protein, partial [Alistipes sp.]|nr:undecaprenyl diphosphate synthase family protein [Alistipes sp.]
MSDRKRIPQHVAIIMDGNGRWAEQRGLERCEGHAAGIEPIRASARAAIRHGVRYLTLYAFSTENWGRPAEEVEALME